MESVNILKVTDHSQAYRRTRDSSFQGRKYNYVNILNFMAETHEGVIFR
jgi:hypothetical protein